MTTQQYPIVALNLHSSEEPFWNWLGVHQIEMGKEVSYRFPVHVIQHIFQITLSHFLPTVSHRAILHCMFRYRPQRWLITNGSFDQWWGTTENPFYHFQGLPFQNPSHCYLWSFFNGDCEKHLLLTMVEVNRPNIMHTQEKRCYIQENIASFTWHRQKSKNMRENGLTCFNQTKITHFHIRRLVQKSLKSQKKKWNH